MKNKKNLLIIGLIAALTATAFSSSLNSKSGINKTDDIEDYLYSTLIGGTGREIAITLIKDSESNIIVTGGTYSNDFPVTEGAEQENYGGQVDNNIHYNGGDVFLMKFSPNMELLWSTYLGGSSFEWGQWLYVDSYDNILLLGYTESSNFPVTNDANQSTYGGSGDIFISKFSPNGSIYYSSYFGSSGTENFEKAIIDSQEKIIICGVVTSGDFYTTPDAYQSSLNGPVDAFISIFDSDFTNIEYSTFFGGNDWDSGGTIAVDAYDNIYFGGTTESTNLPVTENAIQSTFGGDRDYFACKFTRSTMELDYCTYLGGNNPDDGFGLDVTSEGIMILSGRTASANFLLTENAYSSTFGEGTFDAYITIISENGSLIYSSFYGDDNWEALQQTYVDDEDNIYLAGNFGDSGYPLTHNIIPGLEVEGSNLVIMKLSSNGTAEFSSLIGGNNTETPFGLTSDEGILYISGLTRSADFPVTDNAYQKEFLGEYDAFIVVLDIEEFLNSDYTDNEETKDSPAFEILIVTLTLYFSTFKRKTKNN